MDTVTRSPGTAARVTRSPALPGSSGTWHSSTELKPASCSARTSASSVRWKANVVSIDLKRRAPHLRRVAVLVLAHPVAGVGARAHQGVDHQHALAELPPPAQESRDLLLAEVVQQPEAEHDVELPVGRRAATARASSCRNVTFARSWRAAHAAPNSIRSVRRMASTRAPRSPASIAYTPSPHPRSRIRSPSNGRRARSVTNCITRRTFTALPSPTCGAPGAGLQALAGEQIQGFGVQLRHDAAKRVSRVPSRDDQLHTFSQRLAAEWSCGGARPYRDVAACAMPRTGWVSDVSFTTAATPEDAWRCCEFWQRKVIDKWNAREFVARHGFRVPELYWYGDDPASAPWDTIPDSFAVRPVRGTHDHGVRVVADGVELLRGEPGPRRGRPRRHLVEEFARSEEGGHERPVNYKLHTFGGTVAAVKVVERTQDGEARLRYYTSAWEPFDDPMNTYHPQAELRDPPACLDELLACAERLGAALGTYMRIDLFATDRGCMFNEFSCTPLNGLHNTPHCDELFGRLSAHMDPSASSRLRSTHGECRRISAARRPSRGGDRGRARHRSRHRDAPGERRRRRLRSGIATGRRRPKPHAGFVSRRGVATTVDVTEPDSIAAGLEETLARRGPRWRCW